VRKSLFTEKQIIGVLKEQEAGLAVAELCRKHGISQQTPYRWKAKYGGLEVSEARRLRELEEENRAAQACLGRVDAGQSGALKAVLSKK
jgi:putative transposase